MADLLSKTTAEQLADLSSHEAYTNDEAIGRGNGGRGLKRRTAQPNAVNCPNTSLEYDGTRLLENADVKFFPGRIYCLLGRNGVGKSTLLKTLSTRTLLGMPKNLKTYLVPQDVLPSDATVREYVVGLDSRIPSLEAQLEEAEDEKDIEEICAKLAAVEEQMDDDRHLESALMAFGCEGFEGKRMSELSGGERKRIALSCAVLFEPTLLLLDEPTNHLDAMGIAMIRDFLYSLSDKCCAVVVSHNRDLVDSVATDVVEICQKKLTYYHGNFNDHLKQKQESDKAATKVATNINKERERLATSMAKMKNQGGDKRMKQIESRKKKLERTGVTKNENGHRWTQQSAGTGMKKGSINSLLDASTRSKARLPSQMRKVQGVLMPFIDKEIQFVFKPVEAEFREPLLRVEDMVFGWGGSSSKDLLYAEMSIAQRSRHVILAENGGGKTCLLRVICGDLKPKEGRVRRCGNLSVGVYSQLVSDELLMMAEDDDTPLSFMCRLSPGISEFDMRGELSAMGLGPQKIFTPIRLLSGGERVRLVLTRLVLQRPHLLILDEPSNHLDLDSVHALGVGLGAKWDGAVVLATHDSNLVRLVCDTKSEVTYWRVAEVDESIGLSYERSVRRLNREEVDSYFDKGAF